MSEMKHTPGPWEFGKNNSWLFRDNYKADGNFSSTTVLAVHNAAFTPREADALLIATTPELLELVIQYRDDLRRPPSEESKERRLERINEVLRKAGVL